MNKGRTNILEIHTPEGVVFSLRLAGPVTRFLSWLIDFFCIIVISTTLFNVIGILKPISNDLVAALSILSFFLVSIGYSIFLEWFWNGQTFGKRLLHLRVMDIQGLHLKFSQIVIRNLLRFIDSLPLLYMVGGISTLLTHKAQRIGDLAANTIVVWHQETKKPDFTQLFSDKYNSFRNYPYLGARLRQHVNPKEADIALNALLRRENLEPIARIELFREIASYFRTLVEFPQEAVDGLSDEQYIRNIVDILFRPDG